MAADAPFSPQELLEIQRSTVASIETLRSIIHDRSITSANRELARETLAVTERNLAKIRAVLERVSNGQ